MFESVCGNTSILWWNTERGKKKKPSKTCISAEISQTSIFLFFFYRFLLFLYHMFFFSVQPKSILFHFLCYLIVAYLECSASVPVLMQLLWLCRGFWRCVQRWPQIGRGLSLKRPFYYHLQPHKTRRILVRNQSVHTMAAFTSDSQP